MDLRRRLFATIFASATLALAACSSGSSDAPTGKTELTVGLTDAPVDDVTQVHVQITKLTLKPEGSGPAFDLPLTSTPINVDLLDLTNGQAAILVDGATIDPGKYAWLRMDVNAEFDGVTDSYVVTDTGAWVELRVPSGRVQLVSGFEATANAAMKLIFDWDLRQGLVHPPGQPGYFLKPAFRIIGTESFGKISGAIDVPTVQLAANDCNADTDPDNIDVGNTVYVYQGQNVIPDDIDTLNDVTPFATVDAVLNAAATDYTYSILLPFGDYTVAFTCQSANDGAETNETGTVAPAVDTVKFFTPATNVPLNSIQPTATVDF
jgi:hypothetical protein